MAEEAERNQESFSPKFGQAIKKLFSFTNIPHHPFWETIGGWIWLYPLNLREAVRRQACGYPLFGTGTQGRFQFLGHFAWLSLPLVFITCESSFPVKAHWEGVKRNELWNSDLAWICEVFLTFYTSDRGLFYGLASICEENMAKMAVILKTQVGHLLSGCLVLWQKSSGFVR